MAKNNLESLDYLVSEAPFSLYNFKVARQCKTLKRGRLDPWVGKIPWNRKWEPTLVFSPGKSQGQRNAAPYGPWDCKESDRKHSPQWIFPKVSTAGFADCRPTITRNEFLLLKSYFVKKKKKKKKVCFGTGPH